MLLDSGCKGKRVVTTIIVDVANGDDERMVNALALIIVAYSPLSFFIHFIHRTE